MLYLVKLDNSYKIGFSKDIHNRIKQIGVTHTEVELISTKFGNKEDEKELHLLCKAFWIKNELFEINKTVEQIFNTYISIHLQKSINNKIGNDRKIIEKYEELVEVQHKLIESYETLLNEHK